MSTPWHLGPLAGFDLESSDKHAHTARIVTAYVGLYGPKRTGEGRARDVRAQVLINPGVEIPQEAIDIHGITNERARAEGVDPYDALNLIAEELAGLLTARIPVVGHNIAYDFTLLYHECRRWDLPTVAERMGLPPDRPVGPVIDTFVLDKHFDPWRKGSRKLDDSKGPGVATHYGVPLGAAHTADADAEAAVRVAVKIAEKYASHSDMPADARTLHKHQKFWRAEQAASLQHYFRTKGDKPDAFVDSCWPICTDPAHTAAG